MSEAATPSSRQMSLRQSVAMTRETLTANELLFVDEIVENGNEEELETLLATLEDTNVFFHQSEETSDPLSRGSELRLQMIQERKSCIQRNSLWRRSSVRINKNNNQTTSRQQPQSLFTLEELKELEASYDENDDTETDEKKTEESQENPTTSEIEEEDNHDFQQAAIKRASRNVYLGEGFEVGAKDLFAMYEDANENPDYDPWRDNLKMDEEGHRFDFHIIGTSPDDVDAQPHALSPPQMHALQEHLPMSCRGATFWLKYSLVRDGASFSTLLQHVRGSSQTVMAIETVDGEVFGAFTTSSWTIQPNYFGSGECFLWRMKNNRADVSGMSLFEQAKQESDIEVFKYSYHNNFSQLCQHDRIGLGGGITSVAKEIQGEVIEPSGFGFGIIFEGCNLLEASSSPCITFDSPSLSRIHSDGSRFEIVNLELWTLTPCLTLGEARKMECQKLFLKRNVTV
jgi:hypothetical protein